ncbi:MAG TPA: hypothetical protein VIU93_14345 [Gallionellaceae bacterium]
MRMPFALLCTIGLLHSGFSHAEESPPAKEKGADWLIPSLSLGISYPLVVSASIGAIVPLGRPAAHPYYDIIPSIPAVRIDEEIGLGGTTTSVGLVLPRENGMLSLKKARLRTWLMPWNIEAGKIFDGTVVEFAVAGHIPAKLGLGRFSEVDPPDGAAISLTYIFLGLGW